MKNRQLTLPNLKFQCLTKKLYLSAIIDLYDRSIVAYTLSNRNNNKLVFDTLDLAIDHNSGATPLFHSDRGFQYTNKVFQKLTYGQLLSILLKKFHYNLHFKPLWN